MSKRSNQEPDLQWLEDAITLIASTALLLVVQVLTIFFELVFAIGRAITGKSDDVIE